MSRLILKRKNLEYSLMWLMQVLGLGPGMGDVHFVYSNASAAPYLWLREIGVDTSHLHSSLANGYANLTTDRNDVLCLTPEVHTVTTSTNWAANYTHLVGLGGPNTMGRKGLSGTGPSQPGCMIFANTANLADVMHVTGARNQFHNVQFVNASNTAGANTALWLGNTLNTSYGNYFKNCMFAGIMGTACNEVVHSSLKVGLGASHSWFDHCHIGQNTYGGDRSTPYQGHLLCPGTADPDTVTGLGGYESQNVLFSDSYFWSRAQSNGKPVHVRIGGGTANTGGPTGDEAMGRIVSFQRCVFTNWYYVLESVFDLNSLSGYFVDLTDCVAHRAAEWRVVRASQAPEGSGTLKVSGVNTLSNATDAGIGIEPTA